MDANRASVYGQTRRIADVCSVGLNDRASEHVHRARGDQPPCPQTLHIDRQTVDGQRD